MDIVKCINCKETYDDEFKFCPYCGEEKPAPKICPNCKLEPNVEFSFCPECGEGLINKKEYEEDPEKIENEEHSKNKKRKKEEKLDRLEKESKKLKLENIVVSSDSIDSKSKTNLISKINENIITTENELKLEIRLIYHEEIIKEEKRKLKLKKYVDTNFEIFSEYHIYEVKRKIDRNEIKTEDQLGDEWERLLYLERGIKP